MSAELQSTAVFAEAEERFTRAMAAAEAAGETQLLNLARVGRARALLNQGDAAGAAADAALVPENFVYNLTSTEVAHVGARGVGRGRNDQHRTWRVHDHVRRRRTKSLSR